MKIIIYTLKYQYIKNNKKPPENLFIILNKKNNKNH
jgi:hypothetical protein